MSVWTLDNDRMHEIQILSSEEQTTEKRIDLLPVATVEVLKFEHTAFSSIFYSIAP